MATLVEWEETESAEDYAVNAFHHEAVPVPVDEHRWMVSSWTPQRYQHMVVFVLAVVGVCTALTFAAVLFLGSRRSWTDSQPHVTPPATSLPLNPVPQGPFHHWLLTTTAQDREWTWMVHLEGEGRMLWQGWQRGALQWVLRAACWTHVPLQNHFSPSHTLPSWDHRGPTRLPTGWTVSDMWEGQDMPAQDWLVPETGCRVTSPLTETLPFLPLRDTALSWAHTSELQLMDRLMRTAFSDTVAVPPFRVHGFGSLPECHSWHEPLQEACSAWEQCRRMQPLRTCSCATQLMQELTRPWVDQLVCGVCVRNHTSGCGCWGAIMGVRKWLRTTRCLDEGTCTYHAPGPLPSVSSSGEFSWTTPQLPGRCVLDVPQWLQSKEALL